ncbi:MAG TPA: GDSL-type esterase/lipase family protein [bacterium]|nr:GDSL-type esterase/lipase family protein [bacterium]
MNSRPPESPPARRFPWYFPLLGLLVSGMVALLFGETVCRVAGLGRPNLTLTGPKRLYVPDPDPQIAFRMRPGYQDFVYGAPVAINAQGLRDREYPYAKTPVQKRILVLGDSVAFGYGVPARDTFAKQWEELLQAVPRPDWQIINAGVPGYTTVQEVRWFEVEGLRYQPDAVILTYVMNDPEEVHSLDANGQIAPLPADEFYRAVSDLLPQPVLPFTRYSYLLKFLDRWFQYADPRWHDIHDRLTRYFAQDIFNQPGWSQCQDAIGRLRQICHERGIFLLVVIYPTMYRLHSVDEHPFTPHYRRVLSYLEANAIPGLLPLPDFIGQSVDAMRAYVDDPHPSRKSHQIFARGLHRELQRIWLDYPKKIPG